MEDKIDISVDFAGLHLANPVFAASGTAGYGDELAEFINISAIGGFITKSITLEPRRGNPPPRAVETDSGMLNAIGLANIGLEKFVNEKLPILSNMKPVVFVNIAGETIEEYAAIAERLCTEKAIAGFELNISCPNVKKGGICFGTEPSVVEQITSTVKKACKKKILMVKLSPAVTDISEIASAAIDGGADAISLINTFTAMAIDIETRRPILANRTGGLSGPAIKPIALYLVHKVYTEVTKKRNIPIMGLGGIRTAADAIEFMIAGATVIAIGTANFVDPDVSIKVIEGIKKYCSRNKITTVREIVGSIL